MKRLRIGQRVRVSDPLRLAVRTWDPEIHACRGAGGMPIPRELIDGPGTVVSLATGADRGLVAFVDPDGNLGMWLEAKDLEPRFTGGETERGSR